MKNISIVNKIEIKMNMSMFEIMLSYDWMQIIKYFEKKVYNNNLFCNSQLSCFRDIAFKFENLLLLKIFKSKYPLKMC